MHQWVDSRVDPNPASPGIISVLQDAEAHNRWHPIGDGYTPRPGDWVLFDGHVEVVTTYAGGVLSTIGGDSGPNLSVNAHQYGGPLADAGVAGFVNNGELASAVSQASGTSQAGSAAQDSGAAGGAAAVSAEQGATAQGQASVPGLVTPALSLGSGAQAPGQQQPSQPGGPAAAPAAQPADPAAAQPTVAGTASIPGARPVSGTVTSYSRAPSGHSSAPSGVPVQPEPGCTRNRDRLGYPHAAGLHQ